MRYLAVVLFFSLTACTPTPEVWFRTYIIENTTDTTVRISFFKEGSPVPGMFSEAVLMYSERLVGSRNRLDVDPSMSETLEGLPISSFRSADSVLFVFNDTRRLSYTNIGATVFSEPLSRNLFRDSNYEAIGNDEFLYKITEADVERAEDCQGDCN